MSSKIEQAARALGELAQPHFPVATLTTYKVGGTAALFCRVNDLASLLKVVQVAKDSSLNLVVLGRGSNSLFADTEFEGIVAQLGDFAQHLDLPKHSEKSVVVVGSGVALPVMARRTAGAGLCGFEWAVGVPGTIGGAIKMNAGGHGSDIDESLVSVRMYSSSSGQIREMEKSDLGLRFRGSSIADDDIVIDATFQLTWGDSERALSMIDDIVKWRRENQPGGQNAGSVFVNPVPGEVAAGELIDQSGLRGFRIGTAEVSTKHANFIQADPEGCASDVVAVMEHVKKVVKDKHGFDLRSEVRLIGFDDETRSRGTHE
ncbi:MAG: UDP-N-acetylmuramate dehydrogenase [Actinomycetes bacterium]